MPSLLFINEGKKEAMFPCDGIQHHEFAYQSLHTVV
jgi:hypothetical protein